MTRSTAAATAAEVLQAPVYPVVKSKPAVALVAEYADAKDQVKQLEARIAQLKPAIEAELDKAKSDVVVFGNRVVTRNNIEAIPATPNRVITPSMVGGVIPGKRGKSAYTQLVVQ